MRAAAQGPSEYGSGHVSIDTGDAVNEGELIVPTGAKGLILFAHGSGSSRHSPRNRAVAEALRAEGLATLLFDLLTEPEARSDENTGALRFDIALLARRLIGATNWAANQPGTGKLGLGLFGASTGAAAALIAAAELPGLVGAVVSRGGRPDLAGDALLRVKSPTLLIVGGHDGEVLDLNRVALRQLHCRKELLIVPGATHLFEEPGTLAEVARSAARWFITHLHAPSP